jgi:Ca2+-binding RTX toxin-like protein
MAKITGSSSNDFLYGTSNADMIDGGARRDYINGGGGDDTIIGGLGLDLIDGGKGNDTLFFGRYHDADTVFNFSRTAGNMDVIDLGEGMDAYLVTAESNGIRIATVDSDVTIENDPVYGSILLSGVSASQWQLWGGQLGWFTDQYNPNPMITFGPDYHLIA